MAHPAQKAFFESVKEKYPEAFKGVRVLDCGSLNVNGKLKDLFEDSSYVGIDIVPGDNVDMVKSVAQFKADMFGAKYDTIISGEMLEHDENWKQDIQNMIDMLRPGGLLAVSCAGKGRPEHGTRRTGNEWGTNPDYYRNVTREDVKPFMDQFNDWKIIENENDQDTYFYGIKK